MSDNKNNNTPSISNTNDTIVYWGWFLNIFSLISVFCFSGIIFGWAPLELWLLEEDQYSEYCNDNNNETTDTTTDASAACPEQMNHLNALFTIAQFLLSFASLPVGYLLDTCPSKSLYFGMAGTLEIVGLALFSISDTHSTASNKDHFLVGYALMALGGGMTMLGAFPASFLLPNYQTAILAGISCLFDSSSIVFYVFYKLRHYLTRQEWFGVWMGMAVAIYTLLAIGWFRLEQLQKQQQQQSTNEKEKEEEEESTSLFNNNSNDENDDKEEHNSDEHHQRMARLGYHSMTVTQQLCTWEYGLAVFFTCCQMLRCNFFIMTVDSFLYLQGDVDSVYANLFSWILPCGVFVVPFIDITLRSFGVVNTLQVTNGIGFVFGILLLIPSCLPVQAVNFGIFTCFRAFLYATLNTFIAYSFGVNTMGRLMGFVFTMAAIVTLLQYPFSVWAGATSFTTVNSVLLLTLGLFPVLATLIFQRSRNRGRTIVTATMVSHGSSDMAVSN